MTKFNFFLMGAFGVSVIVPTTFAFTLPTTKSLITHNIVKKTSPDHLHSRNKCKSHLYNSKRSDCNNHDKSISRRKSLSTGFSTLLLPFTASTFITSPFPFPLPPPPAQAAIPTMDDYENTANGSQIKSQTKLTKSQEQMITILSQTQSIENKNSLITLSEKVIKSLNALDPLVNTADWAAVRSVLRSEGQYDGNVLGMVRKTYLGVSTNSSGGAGTKKGGEKVLRSILGPDVDVSKLEDAREDLSFSLSQLEDFALENRSIFFNSLDKKQVDELINETGFTEKITEGKDLLKAAKVSADDFKVIMSTI